jgi:predicted AAA+ superfamily ATPase
LLEIDNESHVNTHPLRGSLFENLIILELLKKRLNNGQRSNLYYWRERSGIEIDILMEQATQIIPVEIKTATTFNSDFLKGINYWKKLKPAIKNSYLVYTGKSSTIDNTDILNWKKISGIKN